MIAANKKFVECYKTKSKLISLEAEFTGIIANRGRLPGCGITIALGRSDGDLWSVCYEENELHGFSSESFDAVTTNSIEQYYNACKTAYAVYRNHIAELGNKNLEAFSNVELLRFFNLTFRKYADCLAYYRFTNEEFHVRTDKFVRQLLIDKGFSENELQVLLYTNLDGTMINDEMKDWELILQQHGHQTNAENECALQNHAKKYAFLFGGSTVDLNDVYEVYRNRLRNRNEAFIASENDDAERNRQLLLSQLQLSNFELAVIENMRLLAKLRLSMREDFTTSNRQSAPMYQEIYRRTIPQLSAEDPRLRLISIQDIQSCLLKGTTLSETLLSNRMHGINYLMQNNELIFWDNHIFSIKERDSYISIRSATLQGQVACAKGIIEGWAVVTSHETVFSDLLRYNHVDSIILILPSVHPTVIVSGTKIAGIITDEGGLLSHASIIARELGVPCITSTRNATKIFETGDRIQLNSETGEVRKLENISAILSNKHKHRYNSEEVGILYLEEIDPKHKQLVGNKAWNLSKHLKRHMIPEGACLTSEHCKTLSNWDEILGSYAGVFNDLIKEANTSEQWETVDSLIDEIKNKFMKRKQEVRVEPYIYAVVESLFPAIVRSSSIDEDMTTHSFAGLYESIKGIYDHRSLIDAIFEVVISAFTRNHLIYRFKNDFSVIPPCPALIIQRKVTPTNIGVTFTLDPISNDPDIIVINEHELQAADQTDFHTLRISKQTLHTLKSNLRNHTHRRLSQSQINQLVRMAIDLEIKEGLPLDIEWCFDNDHCYLLQVRRAKCQNLPREVKIHGRV